MTYTLDLIIKEYMNERGVDNMSYYQRYLGFAISAVREMNLDVSGIAKTVELEIENGVSDLPKDFISYKRIYLCKCNEIIPLGYNKNLCTFEKTNIPIEITCEDSVFTYCNDYEPNIDHNGCGCGCNSCSGSCTCKTPYNKGQYNSQYGYYKIDKEANQIVFSSNCIGSVFLEYLGDATKIKGDYIISQYDIEAIKAFIYWASIRYNKYSNGGEKQYAQMAYYNEKRKARARHKSITLDEFMQAILKNRKQSN